MTKEQMIQELKTEAANNAASNAVFHMFALRKRARRSITIHGLYQRMLKEGFDFKRQEYTSVLKLLDKLGFGSLALNKNGNVKGLYNIQVTLQSIGRLVCEKTTELSGVRTKNSFKTIVSTIDNKPKTLDFTVGLTLKINNKDLQIQVPKDMTTGEIATLINKLNHS